MDKTMLTISKKTCTLLLLWLAGALLFQACATYTPKQPVASPTPSPVPAVPEKQKQPVPKPESVRQAPEQPSAVAVNFSRQAAMQMNEGRPDLAAATLERGLRAAPKDATLWSQLAEVKLQQQQYLQARSLAAKSNSLAGTNATIVQKNHWIIEESLKRAE
jgi:tetratricopeptide (TPR) repeat protein